MNPTYFLASLFGQESRPEFVAKPGAEYMEEWVEVSGREFLGTP